MIYPITSETERLFNEGGNFTERRELPNWFEGVCPEDFRPPFTGDDKTKADGVGDIEEREFNEKSTLNGKP